MNKASDVVFDKIHHASEAAKAKLGSTPLVTAAARLDKEAINALLAAGYKDLEERSGGCTALMSAAQRGMDSSVRALLDAGANKEATEQVRNEVVLQSTKMG